MLKRYEQCADVLVSSSYVRFLRARKFDVEKAKAMIISCEQWRKDFGVDEIMT